MPLLVSAANVSGVQWDMVDGSSLATERTSSFQVCHVLRHRTEHALCLTACQMHVEGCRWRTLIGLLYACTTYHILLLQLVW